MEFPLSFQQTCLSLSRGCHCDPIKEETEAPCGKVRATMSQSTAGWGTWSSTQATRLTPPFLVLALALHLESIHYDFRGLGSSGASVSPPRSTIQMLKSLLGSDARWMLQSVTFPSLPLRQRSHSSVSCLSPHMLASCVSCKT